MLNNYSANLIKVLNSFDRKLHANFEKLKTSTYNSLRKGKKVIFFGNGGSASDAEHLATEFIVKFKTERKSLPSISLTSNTSLITACANDFDFSYIFKRQLESILENGDIVIGISTSGKSKNVLKALDYANKKKNFTCLFTGNYKTKNKYKCIISIPSKETARIQECHILIGHALIEDIEKKYGFKTHIK